MSARDDELRVGLARCLSAHFGAPVEISEMRYMTGGSSRILARFTARTAFETHNLVFRLDPETSFVESDRKVEFNVLKALAGGPVPTPLPVFLDGDGEIFGAPFFIMTEFSEGRASRFFDVLPYGMHAAEIGRQVFNCLGRLAAVDVDANGIRDAAPPTGPNPAVSQLNYWEAVIDADETEPQPILRAGIRALRRHMLAPPPRLCVVHGDMRSGNFLFDDDRLIALLDWEFVHLGDPLEDIAWCADPLWGHNNPDLVGGMLPLPDAISAWEAGSGANADPARLEWWRLFSAVKGMAMWTSATEAFLRPDGAAPAMASPALSCAPVHERIIAETLWRWEHAT